MTAELVRGQNQALPWTRLEIGVEAGRALALGAVLVGEAGHALGGAEGITLPGAPPLPGLAAPGPPAPTQRLAVDLGALPAAATRVDLFLALPDEPARFGSLAAPRVLLLGPGGERAAVFAVTGLAEETAVVAVELYRRNGAWKIRAVGQGYQGGVPALLTDRGIAPETARRLGAGAQAHPVAPAPAAPRPGPEPVPAPAGGPGPTAPSGGRVDYTHPGRRPAAPAAGHPYAAPAPAAPAPPAAPATPVAGDASGWSMEERLHNQVWGMFEDLARTVAAYRGAVEFAEDRRERELDAVLDDPRARTGQGAADARAVASERYETLVARAQEALDRDLAQLAAECQVVEPALPPALAGWESPVWHAYRPPEQPPLAVRLGDLRLPEAPELRIPMLVRLPLERGLWIDAGRLSDGEGESRPAGLRALAADSAALHATRLLAVHPPGGLTVHLLDPAGSGAAAFAGLRTAGLLAPAPPAGAAGVAEVLERLTRRVDLVQMAVRGGARDALPPGLDTAEQLLVVHDFPHGFDDRAVTRLRYLADEGPALGVHLLLVADRDDAAAYGPLLDPLWRGLLRITPLPDGHLADPWVRHLWTFTPPCVPTGSAVLETVVGATARARRTSR
ncbi:TerD family protein [Streptomyces sp. CHA1]|uniref:TerD family protein n=1 Tax=unclassified Streptomyces TaxID=2593676 RepID=UPI002094461A|nr:MULTISPECIES: TerD family protein [unclassified Streptomyces]MCO6703635.1 TerD family protein [Streptomyces sp. CHB9.2]MCO6709847.1 TerD family protein [Streptomyces sp. CHA3]MCO6745333.1 TerD family protein [Streptomyces sp. CHA1]MCO6762320.1 TerD family protein [Streptomyces sp. EL5]UUD70548.1 TerD family protein [Streptomyces sp. G11C(2021)]